MLGMADEEAGKRQPECHQQAAPRGDLPLPGQRDDSEPKDQPECQPVRQESPNRGTEQPGQEENHRAVSAVLDIHEVWLAPVGPRVPLQQLPMPREIRDQHVVRTEQSVSIPDGKGLPEQKLPQSKGKNRDERSGRREVGEGAFELGHRPQTTVGLGKASSTPMWAQTPKRLFLHLHPHRIGVASVWN